ncbi:MAG: guanylate kinase [Planctomycetes bacterium]|nr:guanylate kinase [Planctomycetota bacterium]
MANPDKVLVVSGPSGVGKTTLCDRLLKDEPRVKACVTATTRAPRPGETDGKDYYFVSKETFKNWLEKDEIIEHTELYGEFYGTPKKSVDEIFAQGCYPLLRIDVDGAENLRNKGYKGVFIFIMPPNVQALKERLMKRKTATGDMKKRLARVDEELKRSSEYDFRVVNDDLEKALKEMKGILASKLFK